MNAKMIARLFGLAAFVAIAALSSASRAEDAWGAANKGYWAFQKGDLDLAIDYYTEAIRIDSSYAEAYGSRGMVHNWKREYDLAISDCTDAIKLNSDYAEAYSARGYAYSMSKEPDKAVEDYAEVVRLQPDDVNAYNNLSRAYEEKGDFDKAVEFGTEGISVSTKLIVSHSLSAVIHLSKCDFIKAADDGLDILRLQSDFAEAFTGRATAYYDKGEYDKAVADLNESIRLEPDSPEYYNELAWLQATCPDQRYRDGKEALANAKKACGLDGEKTDIYLDTLAAAYAENGDFEKAREYAAKALKAATEEKDKEDCRAHLELFKQDKPFRDEAKKK
jgi:tetratricopeptide (TPR) repeat protein